MAFDVEKLQQSKTTAPIPKVKRVLSPQELAAAQERVTLEEERTYRRGVVSIRDLIAPAAYQVFPNYLLLGDTFVRILFVTMYPRYVGTGWGTPIINYNSTIDIGMYFYPVKPEIILKQLKNKVGVLS